MRLVVMVALCGCSFQPPRIGGDANADPDAFTPTLAFAKTITIHPTGVATELADFPMLFVESSDAELATRAFTDGSDLVFVDTDGVRVPHELELFTKSTGEIRVWIRVPTLHATTPTTLTMGYGAIQPTPPNPTAVWDASFEGVYHFSDTTGTVRDSTSHARDGTMVNTPIVVPTGAIGDAIRFASNGAHVTMGDNFDFMGVTSWTLSFWTKAVTSTPPGTSFARIVARTDYGANAGFSIQQRGGTGHAQVGRVVGGATIFGADTAPLPTTSFVLIHALYDGARVQMYRDGIAGTSTADVRSMPAVSKALTVGSDLYGSVPGDTYFGDVDELRIASTNRSVDWITVESANQAAPAAFYDVGPEVAR